MSIADEISRLNDLRNRGALSNEEFELAKARLLGQGAPQQAGGFASQGGGFAPQDGAMYAELDRIDREWQLERERYMTISRHHGRVVPSVAGSLIGGIGALMGGVIWITTTLNVPGRGFLPPFFPWMGLLFVALGLWIGVGGVLKALAYQKAERAWQERRGAAMSRYGSAPPPANQFGGYR
ncbi:MAG TPA: SHOCT domain-containing protein [Herpetosiphonaceae bacterium]